MTNIIDILQYVVGIDTKELKANATEADKIVEGLGNRIKSMLSGIMTVAGATFAISEFKKFAETLGTFGLQTALDAAREEELDLVLRQVGKTAGYTYSYLKKQENIIKSLGITTDASKNLLIRFMQAQLDVADAAKIARAAQDLAVIGMMNSSDTTEQLTFAIVAQQPRLLRQFGIVVELNDIFAQQAKILNKSTDALSENEKRTAFLNVVLERASRVAGTYEAAMGGAGKQFRTLERYSKEAADAIGKIFLPTFGQMVKDITQGFKDIQKSAEDKKEVKKWADNMLLAYQPLRLNFTILKTLLEASFDAARMLKGALIDLPVGIAKQIAGALGVNIPTQKIKVTREVFTVPEGPPIPSPEKEIKIYSDAVLKERLWLLDQLKKLNILDEVSYLESLNRMMEDTRLNETQKFEIRKLYIEQSIALNQSAVDGQIKLDETVAEFIKKSDEDIAVDKVKLGEELNDTLSVLAEKRMKDQQFEVEFVKGLYQGLGDFAGNIFKSMFASGKSFTESFKSGMKSMADYVINLIGDIIAKWVEMQILKWAGMGFLGLKEGGLIGKMMQTGGLLTGGSAGKDSVPILGEPGEYMLPRPAVESIGLPALEYMRRMGRVPGGGISLRVDMGGVVIQDASQKSLWKLSDRLVETVTEAVKIAISKRQLEF